jgi:transposase
MASLQQHRVRGKTYWRIVESRRVNGKPRPVPIAYLGSANDLLARLTGAEALRISSRSHGGVAALYALSLELDLAGTIDRHLAMEGRRIEVPKSNATAGISKRKLPQINDGITVGNSLVLIAIGRACHATSKRGFAEWAKTTTLDDLAGANMELLTSQHFWNQMDQIPPEIIPIIEAEVVTRAIEKFTLPIDTLLYDATNFFTFIASSNSRTSLPARGHQKQKRNDLRQVSVALMCSRNDGIPLFHNTYAGNMSDAACFHNLLPLIKKRLETMKTNIETVTLIYDKGNVSRANQKMVDEASIHYVTGLTVASQRKLVDEANANLTEVYITDDETVQAWRKRTNIWDAERTAVVVISERLRRGQIAGILQHVESANRWLASLAETLKRGKQRRSKERIEDDIAARLRGRQHLKDVLNVHLTGDKILSLKWEFKQESLDILAGSVLGRIVLITDRHDWSTPEIIKAYRSQAFVEAAFSDLKDNEHLALRPQYHWTDQKIQVHVFTCILGLLLAQLLFLRASNAGAPYASFQSLLNALSRVRRVRVARSVTGKGKLRITNQLEEIEKEIEPFLEVLKVVS